MRKTDKDTSEQYAARLEDAHLQAQHLLFTTSGLLCLQQKENNRLQMAETCAKQHFIVKYNLGMGSNPGESMGVCKCIVPSRHWGTLNSHRAASPLVRLVEGEERWEAFDHHRMFSLKIELEPSQIVLSPA
ncbi:uncharacterized protein TNCV_4034221 [Trichonephila clavipes]|nr:uncharacterized protein TNCV_4034221 [Trichonephila clavipes]